MTTDKAARFEFEKDEHGFLIGPDGIHYTCEADGLFHDLGCTCGCGDPEEQHELIKDALRYFNRDGQDWAKAEGTSGLAKLVAERPDAAAEFIAHVLANERLIEYGGSVHGAWLSDRGRQFLESGPYEG